MRLKKNNFITKLFKKSKQIPLDFDAREFGLFPDTFHRHATEVVNTLQNSGFEAYVVGGGVRDQLLDLHPKDFDVVTNAKPEQIRKCFKRAIIIGRRFRLVHVYFGRYEFVEVATFRKAQTFLSKTLQTSHKKNGIVARDNVYGSIEDDAFRRDFTVNALYYDPAHHKILDFNGGMADMQSKVLRLIGKPAIRLQEDPVRILRALRISNKLGFAIDAPLLKALPKFIPLLKEVAGGRLFDEYQKLFLYGHAKQNFDTLHQWKILPYFFPNLEVALQNETQAKMIECALRNTDERCSVGKTINPAFLIAVFLWFDLQQARIKLEKHHSRREAFVKAMREVLKKQAQMTNMPGYLLDFIGDVWSLQNVLERRNKSKALDILQKPRYRAAYDFLQLRADAGDVKASIANWWKALYEMNQDERKQFLGLAGAELVSLTLPSQVNCYDAT